MFLHIRRNKFWMDALPDNAGGYDIRVTARVEPTFARWKSTGLADGGGCNNIFCDPTFLVELGSLMENARRSLDRFAYKPDDLPVIEPTAS